MSLVCSHAEALHVVVAHGSMMIVGGGPAAAGELLLGPARESFARWLYAADRRPGVPIVQARFGVSAGAVGAAVLAIDTFGATRR